ncbi:MAG: hypothetical protein J0L72_08900 [Armatimonadetes bacterium]|nr:hypothetical protein [Armatimonadota bacterium]
MRSIDVSHLLTESLHSAPRLFTQAEYRLGLFYLAPHQEDLERFFSAQISSAIDQANSVISVLPESAMRTLFGNEDHPLHQGLNRVLNAGQSDKQDGACQRRTAAFVSDQIDTLASEATHQIKELRLASVQRLDSMPERILKARQFGEQAIQRAMAESAADKEQWINEALSRLSEVLEQPIGQRDGYTWMMQGYVNMMRENCAEAAITAFIQATLQTSKYRDAIFIESSRCLAHLQSQRGLHEAAYQTMLKVYQTEKTLSTCAEMVRYTILSDHTSELPTLLDEAFEASPLLILSLLGDAELASQAGDWYKSAIRFADVQVREAKRDVAEWRSLLDRIQSTGEQHGVHLEPPLTVTGPLAELEEAVNSNDALVAWFSRQECKRLSMDTLSICIRQAKTESESHQIQITNSSKSLEELKAWRDHEINMLRYTRETTEAINRQEVGLTTSSDRTQVGCMFASSMGCAGFAIYAILLTFVSGMAGAIGPSSSLGRIILLSISVPIALGIIFTIVDGLRRMAAQNELNRRNLVAKMRSDEGVDQVNEQYSEKYKSIQAQMNEAKKNKETADSVVHALQSMTKTSAEAA